MFDFFKKDNNQEVAVRRVFSVAISEKIVQSALWEVDQTVKVIAKSQAKPYFNDNDLLVKLDGCLQELGLPGESVHETLFHLDSSFTRNQEILAEKKDIFEQVTQALQLKSLGFVANVEAVINARLEQNPELSKQLVVEFVSQKINFNLYQGKTLLTTMVLEAQDDFSAVCQTAFLQLAGSLQQDYSHYFQEQKELAPAVAEAEPVMINFISALITSAEIQEKVGSLPANLPMRAEVLGSDILLSYILLPSAQLIAKNSGWIQVLSVEEAEEKPQTEMTGDANEKTIEAEKIVLSRQKNLMSTAEATKAEKKVSSFKIKKIILPSFILAVLSLIALFLWYIWSQTTVEFFLTPKKSLISKNLALTIDPTTNEVDEEKLILPGEIITKEIEHIVTLSTTGEKEVGEKAYGKVEIINKKTQEQKLDKGTIITVNGINFIFNNDITVPPAEKTEVNDGEKITFAKTDANVTAQEPGAKGNLKNETNLRIENFSTDSLEARAVEDFKGGTDETLRVFAPADEKQALTIAQEEIVDEAQKAIGDKEGETYLVAQMDKLKIIQKKFNATVGDEINEVELHVLATVPVIAYQLEALSPLLMATLSKELPENYTLLGEKPSYLTALNEEKTDLKNNLIALDVDVAQETQALLDVEQIKTQVLGVPLMKAENMLKSHQDIKTCQIKWSNSLIPKISGKIPRKSDKVIIHIQTND